MSLDLKTGFIRFPKIARLSRDVVITEKIDGTNAAVRIIDADHYDGEDLPLIDAIAVVGTMQLYAQSKQQLITPKSDNAGFARWVVENAEELAKLGNGCHFGEWWGLGIQRTYARDRKMFSLFNTHRWGDDAVRPACCSVVPVLYTGPFERADILYGVKYAMNDLQTLGSHAAPGFMRPEGIVIFHTASGYLFKKTLEKDEEWKGKPTPEPKLRTDIQYPAPVGVPAINQPVAA